MGDGRRQIWAKQSFVRLRTALIALGLQGSFACRDVPAFASSTFEASEDGWTLIGNGSSVQPTVDVKGGDPGAAICGQDASDGDVWYFKAPLKYRGNASAAYGKRLTFDLRQSEYLYQLSGRDVILHGGGLAVTANIKPLPPKEWYPYGFELSTEEPWTRDDLTGHGPLATEEELRTVLSDLDSLLIRGEFFDGPADISCLDNVYFGRD